jgi:hypothetical protein
MYYTVLPAILNIDLNLNRSMLLLFCTFTSFFSYISILNKYTNVVYELTDSLHKSFFL